MEYIKSGFNPLYSEEAPTVEQVGELGGDTILEFGAPWCEHCREASSAIKAAINEHSGMSHIKIYDGKGKKLGRAFKVKLWPTLILLNNGEEVARIVRPVEIDEVRQLISNLEQS